MKFNEYSAITGFEFRYLYAKYHKGLAPRIKDWLAYSRGPDTLAELRTQATNLDPHCWKRKDSTAPSRILEINCLCPHQARQNAT